MRWWLVLWLLLLLIVPSQADPAPFVVGSKKMPESALISEMAATVLEERGVKVDRKVDLGGTLICFDALKTGDLDVYPEYTGSGLDILRAPSPGDADATFRYLRGVFFERYHLVWLPPLGFSDTYALAMREDKAQSLGIRTLSDLAAHQADLRFASSHEFMDRQDGWPGLAQAYGFAPDKAVGMEHGLLYKALAQGKVDVIEVYSTEGKIASEHLRLLKDDKNFFPPYQACLVVRQDAMDAHPGAQTALEFLSGTLDDETMQKLNSAVEEEGQRPHQVAVDYLSRRKIIGVRPPEVEHEGQSFWSIVWSGETLHLINQHLGLTAAAVVAAMIVGMPLGVLIARQRQAAEAVLGVMGVIQTIPSMALLAFMIPALGLGVKPAVAALFLYALLPIVRNAYTGIVTVDPALVEAAQGIGLSPFQILHLVELPLATPMLMAGLRTSVVINIGTATLAAFIGAGGLGDYIFTGLTTDNNAKILAGAVPAALLAVLADVLLSRVEKWASPKGLTR
ncbi:MAG TPA: glycine betaine ABC transporter substrate-binding protein [Candidatus Xenobia bacterium]|jgi:osmoprotectant transport system permease protein